jgi:hypothetical protein
MRKIMCLEQTRVFSCAVYSCLPLTKFQSFIGDEGSAGFRLTRGRLYLIGVRPFHYTAGSHRALANFVT